MKYLIPISLLGSFWAILYWIQPSSVKPIQQSSIGPEYQQITARYKAEYERNRKRIQFQSELNCMADNVYYEAASEPEEGQLAVATVVENRIHHSGYPKTICGVVYERSVDSNHKTICQFSWTCKPKARKSRQLYRQAREIAVKVVAKHERLAEVSDATLFHGDYVHPDWSDKAEFVSQIGSHRFYRE